MSYVIHRIFFAAPVELQAELHAFHDIVGQINETQTMPRGFLIAPGCLPIHMGDKRFFQPVVDSNIRDTRFYVQVLGDSWGPELRNFEADYHLAQACVADPARPLQAVAVFFDKSAGPRAAELAAVQGTEYGSLEEFRALVTELLTGWAASVESAVAVGETHAG